MTKISYDDFINRIDEICERAELGEDFIVYKDDKAVLEIVRPLIKT